MKPPLPGTPLWLRVLTLILGAMVLFWLPVEDTSTRGPVLLAAGGGGLLGLYLLHRSGWRSSRTSPGLALVIGGLSGLAVSPLAVLLMVFKGGLHSHGFPDFTLADLLQILQDTPRWGLTGLLVGSLLATWLWVRRRGGELRADRR